MPTIESDSIHCIGNTTNVNTISGCELCEINLSISYNSVDDIQPLTSLKANRVGINCIVCIQLISFHIIYKN